MTRTGVFTAVERKRAGPALGCVMLLTLLMGSGVSAGVLPNPSFETRYSAWPYERPLSWLREGDSPFSWRSYNEWSTHGTWSVAQFNLATTRVTGGQYQSLFQETGVDLTGIGTIKFDVQLTVFPRGSTAPFEHFEASFLVDRVPLWSQRVGGVYLDQEVSVAGLEGKHRVEIRITALDTSGSTGFGRAYWALWDNIRLIKGQVIIPAVVDLDPSTLNPASNGKWITCYIKLGKDDLGRVYDVNTIDGASVMLNDKDHGVPAYMGDQGWATATANAENVADFDGDGVLERMVKFDRAAVQALVQPPEAEATVSIQGKLAGGRLANGVLASGIPTNVLLEGKATIRVLDNNAKE